MAVEYCYDHDAGLIRIVGHGTVSLDDRVQLFRRLLDDSDLPASAAVMVEVSGVTNTPSTDEVRVIGMLVERLYARFCGRLAIVNNTLGHVSLSHLVAFSADDGYSRVRVFASKEEASDWLQS